MNIEYTYLFEAPRETVWTFIQDQVVLRKSLPGCQTFEEKEEGVFFAELGMNVGPVKGVFTGEVRQVDQEEPSFYRLLVRGKGKPGEIDAVADMRLEEAGQGTRLICTAEVQVTGVLAAVGQRVMNGVAKLMLGQFFKAVDKEIRQLASQA